MRRLLLACALACALSASARAGGTIEPGKDGCPPETVCTANSAPEPADGLVTALTELGELLISLAS